MTLKIGINGFGRIGRIFVRAIKERNLDIDIVGINDLTDTKTLGHLFKYDSIHGVYKGKVEVADGALIIDGDTIPVTAERDPKNLPWAAVGADIVIESTGKFVSGPAAQAHIDAGAKKVIISAPGKDVDGTFVVGVNSDDYDGSKHNIISCASCTTNSLAPMAKVLNDNFGIVKGLMTTIHSYTNDQGTHDAPHKDLRRARAAALSMVPTSTGAAKATALVLPELEGKLNGCAVRVPTPDGSLTDLVTIVEKPTTAEEINAAFKAAAEGPLKGVMEYQPDPIVSIDIVGNTHSSIIDSLSTMVIGGTLVKTFAWYDNEAGFSHRLLDLTLIVGESL